MKFAITDANIFIDLFYLDLIDDFFNLEIELYTSIEVIAELEDEQQEILITRSNLTILNTEDTNYLEELEEELSNRLSPADISVFYHARELNIGILTGDNLLRKISKEHGFDVHGILWVLNEITRSSFISCDDAIKKLQELMNYNRRLPEKECERMIKRWQESND